MTNKEWLQQATEDELIEFFDNLDSFETSPYMSWWDKNYCSNCPAILCRYEDSNRDIPCSFCELENYCTFFPEIDHIPDSKDMLRLWLNQEYHKEGD